MQKTLAKITISLLLMGTSAQLIGEESNTGSSLSPTLYRAVYKADYKGLPVRAVATRELIRREDGTYHLSSVAKSFFASITESSTFKIEDERIIPLEYQYHRSGIGRNRDAILKFDWAKKEVLNNVQSKPWQMKVNTLSLDKLVYQLKMREDLLSAQRQNLPWPALNYEIADGGRLKHYEFEVLNEEQIDTPLGKINTLKIARIKSNANRSTVFWLAPKYEFLLIRFQQLEKNGKGFELLLNHAEFDGKAI